jgi:hypothetical protein
MGWTRAESVLWIVSGRPPTMDPIRAMFRPAPFYSAYGQRIELAVDPSVPPDEVAKVYEAARKRVVDGTIKRQRPRQLELARFAGQRPPGETWAASMARWNEEHDEGDRYRTVNHFEADAGKARKLFLAQRRQIKGGGVARSPRRLRPS